MDDQDGGEDSRVTGVNIPRSPERETSPPRRERGLIEEMEEAQAAGLGG